MGNRYRGGTAMHDDEKPVWCPSLRMAAWAQILLYLSTIVVLIWISQ
jgi:hypothetical protein